MSKQPPVIYLVHGDDEFSVSQFVAEIEHKLGDPASQALSITRIEGSSLSLDELENVVKSLPFLTERRVVVVTDPLARLTSPYLQEKFKSILEQTPPTTALVLAVFTDLYEWEKKESKRWKKDVEHWLLRWVRSAGEKVYVKVFPMKKGAAMAKLIEKQAKDAGGRITPQAASMLASLVGEDTRLAHQEIQKLVAYTNYQRPVELDDVELLTAIAGQADIFVLVDALGNLNARQALVMLRRLEETQEVLSIFGMIVRQFRLLLLAREILGSGGQETQVARLLGMHPYVAGKISAQARNFSLSTLETVYHKLLEIDEAIKTGQVEGDTALDTFVAAFTAHPQ